MQARGIWRSVLGALGSLVRHPLAVALAGLGSLAACLLVLIPLQGLLLQAARSLLLGGALTRELWLTGLALVLATCLWSASLGGALGWLEGGAPAAGRALARAPALAAVGLCVHLCCAAALWAQAAVTGAALSRGQPAAASAGLWALGMVPAGLVAVLAQAAGLLALARIAGRGDPGRGPAALGRAVVDLLQAPGRSLLLLLALGLCCSPLLAPALGLLLASAPYASAGQLALLALASLLLGAAQLWAARGLGLAFAALPAPAC
jgi:hypothetical protein